MLLSCGPPKAAGRWGLAAAWPVDACSLSYAGALCSPVCVQDAPTKSRRSSDQAAQTRIRGRGDPQTPALLTHAAYT